MNLSPHFSSRRNLLALLALSTLAGISAFTIHTPAKEPGRTATQKLAKVFQFSTLPALSLGLYDGEMTFRELLKHGNFGVGTFDALDGELIILNGKAWRVRADGRVSAVDAKTTTPFAAVTHFTPDRSLKITQPTEYSALQRRLSEMLPTPNLPYPIEIRGTFARLKVRSVPKQKKPYRALAEVVKTQSVWEWQNVKGTLVGFRFPAYLSGVNLADYHFHFLSDDKQRGGHVLDCTLEKGDLKLQALRDFEMVLPRGRDFDRANLEVGQGEALDQTEKIQ